MKDASVSVLIIGAGPSGCVAAAYLHKHGISCKIVEKNSFPRFVIGESLLPRCMDHFEEVGLLKCLKAQNFQRKDGARFIRDEKHCHFDFSKKFTSGWNWTWQVPRADFDKALTDELLRKGVPISFESEVTGVYFKLDGSSETTVIHEGSETLIHAKYIIDASGHGRVLPRLLDLDVPSEIPKHASIFTHVYEEDRPNTEEATRITFDVISKGTWLWVIPFSNGITSIGYVGPTAYIESFTGTPTERLQEMMQLSSHYKKRFQRSEYVFEPVTLKNVAKSVKQLYGNGFALTGNSAEFLDPVFSSGVTFATESGLLAAKLMHRELQGIEVDWELEYSDYIRRGVGVFSTYVKEWYTGRLQEIFFHDAVNPQIKAQICSVLAGYVWDTSNPFVKNHHRLVASLAHVIGMEQNSE